METNLKRVKHGSQLMVKVRMYELAGLELTKDKAEKFCTLLSRDAGVPAAPCFHNGKWNTIVTEHRLEIRRKTFPVDDMLVRIEPVEGFFTFVISNPKHQQTIIELYKRALLTQIVKRTDLWTIFGQPSIFYEPDPFLKSDFVNKYKVSAIQGFRRFEIADQYVEGEGLQFSVNISTAFFTSLTVDDYFRLGYVDEFNKLAGRQKEQKGTLMYDGPNGRSKCYFKQYLPNMTLITSGELLVANKKYANLFAYYKEVAPDYEVKPSDRVAAVSFPNMKEKQVLVPANKLILRVMNDALDHKMSQKDKIPPQERTELMNKFWAKLGSKPFGNLFTEVYPGYFRPKEDQCGIVSLPGLLFGDNRRLAPPAERTEATYKKHYSSRRSMLQNCGCFYVPETMPREIHFVFPMRVDEHLAIFFANECCAMIEKVTKIKVEPTVESYQSYESMISELSANHDPGMVVFAFDDEDALTYFNIRYELKDWQLKRLTSYELRRNYKGFKDYKDGIARNGDKGLRNWDSFVEQNVYDIIQQLGCLPYMIEPKLNYDMQLVIDVGAKKKFIGLSLFIYGKNMRIPLYGESIKPKVDSKEEEIAKPLLERYLKALIDENKDTIQDNQLRSMLILRDGKDCGQEFEAIKSVVQHFQSNGIFSADFSYDFIEYHKSTLKQIKIWEKRGAMHVNCLEGSYLLLDKDSVVINTTGAGTLNQGTASPILIKKKYTACDLKKVLADIFVTSQLNYSSPRVSQRLTYPAKRTDEQLRDKMDQEILRF